MATFGGELSSSRASYQRCSRSNKRQLGYQSSVEDPRTTVQAWSIVVRRVPSTPSSCQLMLFRPHSRRTAVDEVISIRGAVGLSHGLKSAVGAGCKVIESDRISNRAPVRVFQRGPVLRTHDREDSG